MTGKPAAEAWRGLRVGDRIRIVRMPWDADAPGYTFPPDLRRVYRRLIARRRPLRVCEIDGQGLPCVRFRFRGRGGSWRRHWLAIADESWARVRSRPPSR